MGSLGGRLRPCVPLALGLYLHPTFLPSASRAELNKRFDLPASVRPRGLEALAPVRLLQWMLEPAYQDKRGKAPWQA